MSSFILLIHFTLCIDGARRNLWQWETGSNQLCVHSWWSYVCILIKQQPHVHYKNCFHPSHLAAQCVIVLLCARHQSKWFMMLRLSKLPFTSSSPLIKIVLCWWSVCWLHSQGKLNLIWIKQMINRLDSINLLMTCFTVEINPIVHFKALKSVFKECLWCLSGFSKHLNMVKHSLFSIFCVILARRFYTHLFTHYKSGA